MRTSLVLVTVLASCGGSPPPPVAIDTAHDACAHCRMIVSIARLAAEIVRPGEEPRILDDIGCLRDYLTAHVVAADATVYVADHRTGLWVNARQALYTRSVSQATPMGSGLLAHVDAASRDADPAAAGGERVHASTILGPAPLRPEGHE